jgi:hypothetical protein
MLEPQLIIGIIAVLVVIIGFIYLAKVIFCLQKQLNEVVLKNDGSKEQTVNNIVKNTNNKDNINVLENHILNECTEAEKTAVTQKISDNQECFEIDRMVDSYLSASVDNDVEVPDYREANIMKVNKIDGLQTNSVDPNRMSLKGTERLFDLDIVVARTPINKAIKNNYVERKR